MPGSTIEMPLRLFEHLNDLPGIAKSRHGLGERS